MKGKICSWKMKAVAWLLAAVMIFSVMPTNVYAATADGSVSEEETDLVLGTTLTDNLTVKGRRKLFDVWARDLQGNTVHPTAVFDGEELIPTWQDDVKTSFTLDFEGKEEGKHEVILSMACAEGSKELTYTVNYEKAEEGEFIGYAVASVEAFTISQGYIIEPRLIPVFEGDNTAKALAEMIREAGYDLNYTGSIESGFYMSNIVGSNAERPQSATKPLLLENVALEPNMLEKKPDLEDFFDADSGEEGALGEFHYGFMSGWMYCVNTVFPNVGGSDYYLSGGDVMRWQFTIAYGGEIGGSGALGGGMEDYYPVANKDALTTTLAYINSAPNSEELKSNPEIATAIEHAKEVLQNIPIGQEEVDEANSALRALLNGEVTGIVLDQSEITLENGNSAVLTPSVTCSGNSIEPVEWKSSNLNVATVKNGTVTAVGEGTATITAVCGGKSATCQVTVPRTPLEKIVLNKTETSIAKGERLTLEASPVPANTTDDWTVTWQSEDELVATVNAGGRVTGVAQGTTVITATAGEYSASCTVTVMEYSMTGVKLNYFTSSVQVSRSMYLSASYLPSNTTDERGGTWQSSNPEIATVTSGGTVRGIKEGTTVITFTSTTGGFQASCLVEVISSAKKAANSITLDKTSVILAPGAGTAELTATLNAGATDPVRWESSDTKVVTVEDGILHPVSLGEAVVTAYAGARSASCKVAVKDPELCAFSLVNGTSATAAAYGITPAFSADVKNYRVIIPDSVTATAVYAKAQLPDGMEGTITARYTTKSGSGTEKTVSLTSGKAAGTSLANFFASGSVAGNTLYIDVAAGGKTTTYQIDVVRETTLASVQVLAGSQKLILTPAFSSDIKEYTVKMPNTFDQVTLEAGAKVSDAVISVNGAEAADGRAVVEVKEDSVTAVIKAAAAGAEAREYKVTFVKTPLVSMRINVTPSDAVLIVKDAEGTEILPESGAYALLSGADYTLKATKNGYVGINEKVNLSADTEKDVTLTATAPSTLKDLPAAWKNFRNSDVHMGITSAKTPKNTLTTYLKWSQKVGTGWGGNAAGSPIIVDDAILIMQGSSLKKYDRKTGELLKSVDMAGAQDYGYTPPTYAAGMIFVPIHGMIQAFNAETLQSLWVYKDALGGQALSPITYADGYVYTGFWNSETKDANYVCVSVADEDPNQEQEEKLSTWEYTSAGGFYWAGALVRGDSVIFGTDDGTSGSAGASSMLSMNRYTGRIQDSLELIGDQRSTVSYDEKTGRIWFTTKGGYLYSVILKADGTFDHASMKSLQVGGASTSTPLVYNGRVYVGVTSGSNFSGKFGVNVIDAEAMSVIYSAELKGYPQCSVLLSNAYEAEDGTVYIYSTYNNKPGGISLIRDKKGQTTADIEEIFVPDASEYCISSIICDEEGTLYYKNDSGYLFAVGSSSAYLTGASVDAQGAVIDDGAAFAGEKVSHEIVVPVSTENITLSLVASEGSEIFVNGEKGTSFQIPVGEEASTVSVKVVREKDERNYTFTVRKQSQDATLSDLKVGTSNGYSSFLTLTPAFDNMTCEYRAEHTSSISFMRLWLKASDANAVIKVYPVSKAGRTEISEDGAIPVTSNSGSNSYRAIYFESGYDCSKVRIEVTAEDGVTTKTFYVSMKQKANNTPFITAGEDAAVHTDNEEGKLTFTSNEYGKAYYQFVEAGGEAPSSISTTGTGIDIEIGENTIDLAGLKKQGGTVYLVVKDTDAAPHISNMISAAIAAYVGPEDGVIEQIETIPYDENGMPDAEIVKQVRAAYDALTDVQKSRVTNYAKLLEAEKKLLEAESQNKDKAAAEAVMKAIDAIGEVTSLNKKGEVAAVRAAYESLSEAQKALVTNLPVLSDAEAQIAKLTAEAEEQAKKDEAEQKRQEELAQQAAPVIEAIKAIGTVSLDSGAAIQAAKDAYAVLSEEAKAKVENYAQLVIAEKELEILKAEAESRDKDKAAANAVVKAITAIGEVISLDKKGEVVAVRAAYESLSEAQKALVTNLPVLSEAEVQIAKLMAEAEEQAKKDKEEQKRQEELAQQAAPVIEAIRAIGTVSLDSGAAIQAVKEAYAALSEEAKAKVENYAQLVIAEKELEILKAEAESRDKDKAAANAVVKAITAIGEVISLDKKGEVVAVRAAYESLSEAQKALVTNLPVLSEAEVQIAKLMAEAEEQAKKDKEEQKRQEELAQQAAPVIEAINAIGTVSLDSEAAIQAAKEAYAALSEEAKAKVENYAQLVIAEKELEILKAEAESKDKDKAAANAVVKAITAIGEVTTLDKKGEVAAVRAAYESLSEAQKALVTNLPVLSDAEAQIEKLTAEAEEQAKKDEAEQKRQEELAQQAAPVIEAIKAIGTVSLDSEAAIQAAKEAYAALSEEAKAKVINYAQLVIAEKELEIQKVEEQQKVQAGQTYPVGDYYYKVTSIEDLTVAVTGLQKNSLKKLVIPDTVTLGNKQYKVTAIAASAFKNNKKITSVTIKKNLEVIGANAFDGCKKLKTVKINSTKLKEIGSKAFCKCRKLTKLTIKSKILKKVGKNAFKGTSAKLTVKVPAAKYQTYKKLLAKKGQSRTAKIKK